MVSGALLLFWGWMRKKTIEKYDQEISEFEKAKKAIRRDYKVSKLGVAYVPVEKEIPFGNSHLVVDLTDETAWTDFSLSTPRRSEDFSKTIESLQKEIRNVPLVESAKNSKQIDSSEYSTSMQNVRMHDYCGTLLQQVNEIRDILSDIDTQSVSLPFVRPDSPEENSFRNFTTSEVPEGHPKVDVFGENKFDDSLKTFDDIDQMKRVLAKKDAELGVNHVEDLKLFMQTLGESVQVITATKSRSCEKLIEYYNGVFANVLKASYNQYSPSLEAEEIQRIHDVLFDYGTDSNSYKPFTLQASSRVKYDLFLSQWVAEDNSRTLSPFSMNQLQEEIFSPLIENLLEESRVERLKVYNDIENQKLDYLTQWHRDADDFNARNRATADDLISEFMNANAEFQTGFEIYKSLSSALDNLKRSGDTADGEVTDLDDEAQNLATMELQAKNCAQVQEEFKDFMNRIQEDIDLKSQQFDYTEFYEGTLRDAEAKDIAVAAGNVQNLDDRRKKLVAINSYIASNAELLPEPQIEEKLSEDFSINLMVEVKNLLKKSEETENVDEETETENSEISDEGEATDVTCPECGAKLDADSKFCEQCGAKIQQKDGVEQLKKTETEEQDRIDENENSESDLSDDSDEIDDSDENSSDSEEIDDFDEDSDDNEDFDDDEDSEDFDDDDEA